jgi:hypothetical protein
MASAPASVTSAVRRVLAEGGNVPTRQSAVWERVKASVPEAGAMTKTHFKEDIVKPMFARGELLKFRVASTDEKGRPSAHYVMRLKETASLRRRLNAAGIAIAPKSDGTGAASGSGVAAEGGVGAAAPAARQ